LSCTRHCRVEHLDRRSGRDHIRNVRCTKFACYRVEDVLRRLRVNCVSANVSQDDDFFAAVRGFVLILAVASAASLANRSALSRAVFLRTARAEASYSIIALSPSRTCSCFFRKLASARSRACPERVDKITSKYRNAPDVGTLSVVRNSDNIERCRRTVEPRWRRRRSLLGRLRSREPRAPGRGVARESSRHAGQGMCGRWNDRIRRLSVPRITDEALAATLRMTLRSSRSQQSQRWSAKEPKSGDTATLGNPPFVRPLFRFGEVATAAFLIRPPTDGGAFTKVRSSPLGVKVRLRTWPV